MQGVACGRNRNRNGNTQFPKNCGQVSVLEKLWVFLRNERQLTFAYFWWEIICWEIVSRD